MRHNATIRKDGHIVASHAVIYLVSADASDTTTGQLGKVYGARLAEIAVGQTYEITLDNGQTINVTITDGTPDSQAKGVIDFQVT
jgi:hypothetical protein